MKNIVLLSIMVVATLVAQAATKYEINVGGVEVTSDNASNVTGGAITKLSSSGKVSYNASTKTLTLTDISISRSGSSDRAIHNRDCEGLKIVLTGTCRFSGSAASTLYFQKSTTLEVNGEATVTCTSSGDDAIYFNKDSGRLTISGSGNLTLSSTKGDGIEASGKYPWLILAITNMTVNSLRENIKNFSDISFNGNTSTGSRINLKPTSGNNYAHISYSTDMKFSNSMGLRNTTDTWVTAIEQLRYGTGYSTEVLVGTYEFDFSSF
ncbi:MAG: hypothetical protein IJ835_05775 [Muribaculaceae bacterium]|nr:hypothetical protein [Muribaculaceae bacterium]